MSISDFELQIQQSTAMVLLNMMVSQLHGIGTMKDTDINKTQLKAMFSETFNELIQKLSSKKDIEIDLIKEFLSSNTKEASFIKDAVTTFYKSNCESLEKAATEYAGVILNERKEIVKETWTSDHYEQTSSEDILYTLSFKTKEDLLNGDVQQIVHTNHNSKETAIQNNSKGSALRDFWTIFTKQNISDDDIIFYEYKAPSHNSKMKESVSNDENWMHYRDRAISGIKALSTPTSQILFQESSPIGSFFMGVVNSVCESMGITPPFQQHKTLKSFKEAVEKVREQTGLEGDSPTDTTTKVIRP